MTGRSRTLFYIVERLGLTHLSQAAILGVTALSLTAIGISISQTLLRENPYSQNPADISQQFPAPDLNLVSQAQLFGIPGAEPGASSDELPSTRLQWVLQGAFTGTRPDNGSAIILAGDQTAQLFKAQQQLPGGAELSEVHADHVVITTDGRRETLRFPTISSITSTDTEPAAEPIGEPVMNIAEDNISNRREIVRQRLEMLRQRALNRQ